MKNIILSLALAAICGGAALAQDSSPVSEPTIAAVPARLQELSYLTETRPVADARFYVYLCSASWCGPCRAIMPDVIKSYADIKAAGGEIILLCMDANADAGRAYLEKYKMEFPAVMAGFGSYSQLQLPGFAKVARLGIPYAVVVTAEGKTLFAGHGSALRQWREIIK